MRVSHETCVSMTFESHAYFSPKNIYYAYNKGNNFRNMRYENQTIGEEKT